MEMNGGEFPCACSNRINVDTLNLPISYCIIECKQLDIDCFVDSLIVIDGLIVENTRVFC